MAAHKHKWREVFWTMSGPIAVRVECLTCVIGFMFRPRKRLRVAPKGLTQARFDGYMLLAEEDELLAAFRARIATASRKQLGDAYSRGILPPMPTFEDLEAYEARTADRRAKKVDEPEFVCNEHDPSDFVERLSGGFYCGVCHPGMAVAA